MDKSQEIPWLRIIAEGGAIVVSILLAFWIDAWWEDRQDRAEEYQVLIALKSEFEENLAIIERELSYRHAVIASITQLFDAASGRSALAPKSVDKLIGDITWWGHGEYITGAINGLLQSGNLSLIENLELRQLLAEIPIVYQAGMRSQFQDKETAINFIFPYLNTHASLPQIANTMTGGRPGTGQIPTPPMYPEIERRNHAELLGDHEFLAILVKEHWDHLDALDYYQNVQQTIERALGIINQEITASLEN